MPSIRHSLIAYFLLLLGAALAGVAILYDRLASEAVEERKTAELQLVDQKLETRNHDAIEKFDSELLIHAKALAREVRQKYFNRPVDLNFTRKFNYAMSLAPLAQGLSPWSTSLAALSVNHPSFRGGLFWGILAAPQSLEETVRQSLDTDDHTGMIQIHLPRLRAPIRPIEQNIFLPLETSALDRVGSMSEEFHRIDEVEIVRDGAYRRVIYRPPFWAVRAPGRLGGSGPGAGPGRESPGREGTRPSSSSRSPSPGDVQGVYVQYARKKADLEAILAEHKQTAEVEREKVIAATQARLSWLRTWLFTIGVVAFVAMVVGGWVLIGRGLAPLANLSEAVSRVSPTDFRLPVEPGELSQELLPIHDRLTQTLDALRRAFEREKQAVADISHELRTPLAALQTSIDVCLRKPRENDRYRETLQECRVIGQQLTRLVDRILTLANLDAGNVQTERTTIQLADLFSDCAAIIRPLARSRDLTFQMHLDPSIHLESDPNKLREILMNLLHNAIEYNKPNGTITLQVRWDSTTESACFEVSDSGIGMTPEVKGKIFERFYRADASRTATGVHAGLGLSIVQEYVTRLGGTISVESEPDQGSAFRFSLPAQLEHELEPALV